MRRILAFHQPGRFEAYPISTAVNATRNNGPQLIEPVPESELKGVVDPMTGEVIGGERPDVEAHGRPRGRRPRQGPGRRHHPPAAQRRAARWCWGTAPAGRAGRSRSSR